MARRRKKGGRRKRKMSLFATAGIVVGLWQLWKHRAAGPDGLFLRLTGWNMASKQWEYKRATAGIAFLGGAAASMIVAKTGLNRYMNIPWFKL